MWSDTLLVAERAHLVLLILWGGASAIAATALVALMTIRARPSPLLRHFAAQIGLWGVVVVALAAWGLLRLDGRDLASATRLDRLTWLSTGLGLGLLVAGATLAGAAWRFGRRLGAIGAGIGIAVQSAGLLALHLRFLAFTVRGL